jgi:hypothetical protein
MEIVERRVHDRVWWARDPSGAWYRWDAATNGWDGPLTPPWPEDPAPHPDEAAIVAAAMAAGARTAQALGDGQPGPVGAGGSTPMNWVDAWWNRRFPPFSSRRLVFGLVMLPVITALVELLWVMAGRQASLARYLFVCVACGAVLAATWLPGMRAIAERMQADGALDTRWPWGRRRDVTPPPPLPPLGETFGRDFRIALPFCAAIVLVMSLTVMGPRDTFGPAGLITIGIGSVFAATMIALRTSVLGLVIFSVAGGLVGGIALVLLSVMTWGEPGLGEFLIGWASGSVLLLLSAYPMWRWVRHQEARGFRLPMWIVMGGTVLLVTGGALVFIAER